jgi:predicted XRE-type DNA-binding protein
MSSGSDAKIYAMRADIALQISATVTRGGATQTETARRLGIPQPTLSKIMNGHVSDISLELLIRVAAKAGLQIALHTGRTAEEAGEFNSPTLHCARLPPHSKTAAAARASLLQAEHRLTPSQRMEAFLEHNQLLASLHRSGREADFRRVRQPRPGP